MSFKVISSGIFTTLQDQGRYGYNHLGRTHSGAMDEYAYFWGQKLLYAFDTRVSCSNALEVMVGLKLEAMGSTTIAVTGADLNFKINGNTQKIWQTHNLKKGDILSFDKRISGQRSYLSVLGGFQAQKTYGSYATTLKEKIGSRLKRDDVLLFTSSSLSSTRRVLKQHIPLYKKTVTLRLLPSYQHAYFDKKEQNIFFNTSYQVTLQSDRMAYKLKGESIVPLKGGIISEAIAFGSVQIPKDGQPIVLLKERQTIGGYPKIGTVLAIDCYKLAQLGMGDSIHFEVITIEKATTIQKKFSTFFKK
jgi:biotin-dependent carboxylase-like uncharacterized protein